MKPTEFSPKLKADEQAVLRLLQRWRDEATKAGRYINRIAVASEAGRDGFWLARWLQAHGVETGVETYVIHASSKRSRASIDGRRRIGSMPITRCRSLEACLHRLAARQAGPLPHGSNPEQEVPNRILSGLFWYCQFTWPASATKPF
jgi:hypothetical protein